MTEPDINHYVQVIGYDSNGNYIIKNSWGIYWGDNGYATIDATMDCGIKIWVFLYETTVPNLLVLNSSTNNNTNLKSYSWNFAFLYTLALVAAFMIV